MPTSKTGLPDFSCHNIPKTGENTQNATKLPNGEKIYQMNHNNFQMSFCIPRPSKFYQNWEFWVESISSGNPVPKHVIA
jgi:hypothetical protein